ncbi:MAG: hypothetical protein M3Y83_00835 [Actinomycetota bacterium]|nr:hypothetical protein [Actinomycetota bacterium]
MAELDQRGPDAPVGGAVTLDRGVDETVATVCMTSLNRPPAPWLAADDDREKIAVAGDFGHLRGNVHRPPSLGNPPRLW